MSQTQQLLERQSFNDDDYYVYSINSLMLLGTYSSKSRPPQPTGGQAMCRGMSAKYLGLWRPVVLK